MLSSIVNFDQNLTLAVNGSDSSVMDSMMLLITSTWVWLPMGIYMLYYIYNKVGLKYCLCVLGGILLCVLIADSVSSGIVKPLVGRWRPARDPQLMYLVDVVNGYRGGRFGFFSSHAANTMSVALFVSWVLRNRLTTVLLILWSLLNCWSRVYLGVHYVGDILVGLVCGVLVAGIVILIFRRLTPKLNLDVDSGIMPVNFQLSTFSVNAAILITYALIAVMPYLLS
ncbi:MAG: phosphatase PAP2 family protein [Bacteroidaceae bacterium]|nr:phosphatase PAP2 family protein [Bacteroidaceae bacterium]